jgi:hypothetical protein
MTDDCSAIKQAVGPGAQSDDVAPIWAYVNEGRAGLIAQFLKPKSNVVRLQDFPRGYAERICAHGTHEQHIATQPRGRNGLIGTLTADARGAFTGCHCLANFRPPIKIAGHVKVYASNDDYIAHRFSCLMKAALSPDGRKILAHILDRDCYPPKGRGVNMKRFIALE